MKIPVILSLLILILNANEIMMNVEEYQSKHKSIKEYIVIANYSGKSINLIVNAEEVYLRNKEYFNSECIVYSDIY